MRVKNIKLLEDTDDHTIAEILIGKKKIIIAQSNKSFDKNTNHTAKELKWAGPFTVLYDGKILK